MKEKGKLRHKKSVSELNADNFLHINSLEVNRRTLFENQLGRVHHKLNVQEYERKIHLQHIVRVNNSLQVYINIYTPSRKKSKKNICRISLKDYFKIAKVGKKYLNRIKSCRQKINNFDSTTFFKSDLTNTNSVSKGPITVSKFLLDFNKIVNAKQDNITKTNKTKKEIVFKKVPNHSRVNSMPQTYITNKRRDEDYEFEDIYDLDKSLNTSSSRLDTETKVELIENINKKYQFVNFNPNEALKRIKQVESLPDINSVKLSTVQQSNSKNKDPGKNVKPKLNEIFSYNKKKWDSYKTKKAEYVISNLKKMELQRNGSMSWVKHI